MDTSDKELFEMISENAEKAFDKIVDKYSERLYWHIRKILIIHEDTDDVLQNTLLKVWKNINKFENKSKLYTWLYRIATNESITFLNNKKKKKTESYESYEYYLSNTLESDSFFEGDEIQLKLQKAILTLPEKQRIVFNMKYFDEMKYKDMAEILKLTEGALKSSYHHAVKKIEKFVKEL